jgi:hypothetical protein
VVVTIMRFRRRRAPAQSLFVEPPPTFPHAWDPARYPPEYLKLGPSEEQVVRATVDYLVAKWRAVVTVIDAGDRRLRGRAAHAIRAAGGDPLVLKGRGTTMDSGIADLHVTFPHLGGRAGWFELKKPALLAPSPKTGRLVIRHPAGAPTDEQLRFLRRQERAGALVGVIWWHHDLDAIVPAAVAEVAR